VSFHLVLLAERESSQTKPKPFDPSSRKFAGRQPLIDEFVLIMFRTAPYEKRIIELLRNNKDKRARKLAKKRV
jgi:hypothetical protein